MNLADFLTRYAAPAAQAPTKAQAPKKAAAKAAAQQAVVKQTLPVGVGPRQGLPSKLEDVEIFAVGFSGGKDSVACVLHLLDLGIPKERIELWHHRMDPLDKPFMDWPVTDDYCRAFATALGLPIYFSGRVGGFEGELLRDNQFTGDVFYEAPTASGRIERHVIPSRTRPDDRGTRLRFPQTVADLSVRWCSAYLKIDVAKRIINNDPRLKTGIYCLVTGERAQESASRSNYAELEEHTNTRAHLVYQWRPVHKWVEEDVWSILKRYRINPHPAYKLGFGRVSCMTCIFANPAQWATVHALNPKQLGRVADYEEQFGPISITKRTIRQRIRGGYEAGKQLRQPTSSDTTFLDNVINGLVQAASKEDRIQILSDALQNEDGLEMAARLPEATLRRLQENMTLPGLKGRVDTLFKTIERLRYEPKLAPPAKSFIPEGMARVARMSQGHKFTEPVLLPASAWEVPAGAYKHDGGPI
jgi:3'-phosphoadenosine 5'-phosphosulfate sulfotransferase (PAPS reductase)/FAD synthetase